MPWQEAAAHHRVLCKPVTAEGRKERRQHMPCPRVSPSPRCRASSRLQEERRALMQKMQQLQAAVAAQEEELAKYAGADPERYDNLSEQRCGAAASWALQSCHALQAVPCNAWLIVQCPPVLFTTLCPPHHPTTTWSCACILAEKTAQLACDSANRWIDNIEALRVRAGVGRAGSQDGAHRGAARVLPWLLRVWPAQGMLVHGANQPTLRCVYCRAG